MNITELVGRAHDNAVKHGFWDPPLNFGTAIALIHSELSEALEEERAGRALVWYKCTAGNGDGTICNPKRWIDCDMGGKEDRCPFRHKKPEGVAVELADAVAIWESTWTLSFPRKWPITKPARSNTGSGFERWWPHEETIHRPSAPGGPDRVCMDRKGNRDTAGRE